MTEQVADKERSQQAQPSQAADWRSGLGVRALTILFVAEVIVLAVAELPLTMSWDTFAFMDQGANLAVQTLLTAGWCRPLILDTSTGSSRFSSVVGGLASWG